jgi:hypothetical protein
VLSKGTAVVIPLLLVLIDLHREAFGRWKEAPAAVGRSLRRVGPLFGISAVFGVVAVLGQKQAEAVAGLERLGMLDRAALFANALGVYAWRTVVPAGLAPLYEMTSDLSAVRMGAALSVAVLLAAAVAAIVLDPRLRSMLLLLCGYVVLVAPVGGLLQVGSQVSADRYAYAAGWALSLLLAGAAAGVLARVSGSRAGWLFAAAAAMGIPLAFLTVRQQAIWHDSVSLWTHQLEDVPRHRDRPLQPGAPARHWSAGRGVRSLGGAALPRGAAHPPDYPEAYRGLGNTLRRLGRREEAIRVYEDGLKTAPRSGPLLYGLAIADVGVGTSRGGHRAPARALRGSSDHRGLVSRARACPRRAR